MGDFFPFRFSLLFRNKTEIPVVPAELSSHKLDKKDIHKKAHNRTKNTIFGLFFYRFEKCYYIIVSFLSPANSAPYSQTYKSLHRVVHHIIQKYKQEQHQCDL